MKFLFVIHDLHEPYNSVPLGPAYVAQALRENGIEVEFYCQDISHSPDSDLEAWILENRYDAVGINFLAARFNRIGPTLAAIRRACTQTGAVMVLGGHGPSPIPEFMLKRTGADVAVIGEGELTTVDLMQAIASSTSLAGVDGIAWIDKSGRIRFNRPRRLITDLDRIPFPSYDLLPMEKYTRQQADRHSQELDQVVFGNMITSRGCIGKCSFCYRMIKGLRLRSIDNIIAEMNLLNAEYGVNYFAFQDETLAANPKRIKEFCRRVSELPYSPSWSTGLRVDMLQDNDTVRMLKESGCVYLSLGLESLNQSVLDLMGKKTTVDQNIRAVELCNAHGLNPGLNLIWGCPGDTEDTLRRQVDFIKEMSSGTECRTVRPVTPYPGTPLYDLAVAEGKLTGPADFFDKFKNSDYVTVNFTNMSTPEMLDALYAANCEIIDDFCDHPQVQQGGRYFSTDKTWMKQLFHDLYFNGFYEFRGVR